MLRDASMSNHTHISSPHPPSFPPVGPPFATLAPTHDHTRTSSDRTSLPQQQPPHHMDSVRLTKDGVPRKKPGRKPGSTARKSGDDITPMTSPGSLPAAPVSDAEPPKQKRARKPKDPDAPPVPRKRRAQPSSATGDELVPPRSSSAHLHFEPKAEFTSMRMDFDPRPAPHPLGPSAILSSVTQPELHPRRQPPIAADKPPAPAKRENHQSSVMSILNTDDTPPRPPQPPASTPPVRSVGQSYDPIRSSYDPVRETMYSRDPYGTGPLASPRGPPQLTTNRSSASPSIASLVNPAPVHHNRPPESSFASSYAQASPPTMTIAAATSSTNGTTSSRYRDHPPSPSPAPALRATTSATSNAAPPPPPPPPPSSILKAAATSSKPSPQVTAASKTTSPAIPPLALSKSAATKASTTARASKASAKADGGKADAKVTKADAKDESEGPIKPNRKPSPTAPASASAKTATAKPLTKAAEKKAAAAAAKAAAADAKAAAAATKAASKAAASEASNTPTADEAAAKSSGPSTTSFKDVAVSAANSAAAVSSPHIKKFSSILQQDRGGKQTKSAASSPKLAAAKGDAQPSSHMALDSSPQAEPERSILDFGKALPGEENAAPSIVLHIPLVKGETNKYINFMRMAEEHYGWDAIHPRLAAHRDRKLRIAAASAALERNGSSRESGDEMTDEMQSGDEGSNEENGATADNTLIGIGASGPEDAPSTKPARKKRIFKEDEYDKDDDFVDDSEMMWEEQAATSRDGFFVYSGPLIPEEEKPAEGTSTPVKRGRGSRGGRGGSTRGGARAATGRGAGGPGSRGGGAPRKPRATKQEKEARDREKAELKEASAKAAAAKAAAAKEAASHPFSSDMAIDDI